MSVDDVAARPVAGRYELRELLGQGGMGSVWLAEDLLLQRRVAVKRVGAPPGMTSEDASAVRSRVLREARAAARVAHARLVTLFDVVEEDGIVYLVQELVEAPTLKELVADQGPRRPSEAASIGLQLLEGLAAAHRAGVVHRDVKPANVMVLGDGGVKLADFGIASLVGDPQLTATGTIIGSPAFMSPEQATGSDVGPPADLWSLGATLYFAVEGEPPFSKPDALSTLTAMLHEPPRPPRRAGALAPVLERLLAKDPAARADVAEAAGLLQAVTGDRDHHVEEGIAEIPPAGQPPPLAATGEARAGASVPPPSSAVTDEVRAESLREGPSSAEVDEVRAEPLGQGSHPAEVDEGRPEPLAQGPPTHASPTPADTQVLRPVAERSAAEPRSRPRRRSPVAAMALVALALVGALALAAAAGRDDAPQEDGQAAETRRPAENPGRAGEPPASRSPEAVAPPAEAQAGAPAGWKSHTDPDTGYRVSYPASWQVKDRDRTRTDFVDPQTGTYLRVDWTDQPGDSPEGAWEAQSRSFGARHPNYREIRIDPTTYKGYRAALWEYTYGQGGGSFHAFNLGFVTDDHGFALNFQAREDRWAEVQPLWDQLKAGFEVPAED
ncbi:MAG TPA: protein kinase [Acidimicrobiales bacterium]|nr:protein kinase [Acidimicrobiales bacterium]